MNTQKSEYDGSLRELTEHLSVKALKVIDLEKSNQSLIDQNRILCGRCEELERETQDKVVVMNEMLQGF